MKNRARHKMQPDTIPMGFFLATLFLVACAFLFSETLQASPTEVVAVRVTGHGAQTRFDVTLRHADTGWEHYARVWVVETLDGKELGRRVLLHPHVEEQPFTRSGTVAIPPGITQVRVRAEDTGGDGSNVVVVELKAK